MSEPTMTEPGCTHPDCVLDHPHAGPAILARDDDVSRETSSSRIGQIFEPELVEVEEEEASRQAELDQAEADRRTKETEALNEAEADNYARTHAIIERDESNEPKE